MHRSFPRLLAPSRAIGSRAHLLGVADRRARAHARRRRPGHFDRYLGPFAAPYFDLHPRLWSLAREDTPARPFERCASIASAGTRRSGAATRTAWHRTLLFEYPRP